MPKNTSAKILSRWREMDLLLWRRELHIPKFAKKRGVSEKTVRRDIRAFTDLGQKITPLTGQGSGYDRASAAKYGEKFYKGDSQVWAYASGAIPLFRHPEEEAMRREQAKKAAERKRLAEEKKRAEAPQQPAKGTRPTNPAARQGPPVGG
jgi:predicted DNA-binding transcriptional regulator YafY